MKKALLLLNMGGPNNLDEVELFLSNMFNDKNILTIKNKFLRAFIAKLIVTSRKKQARQNYEKIGSKSPMVFHSKLLVEKLQSLMMDFHIGFAMAYTPPFCDEFLLSCKNIEKLFILPLYPHYSTTTILSSLEDFQKHHKKHSPSLKYTILPEFYKNEKYNALIIKLICESLKHENPKDFILLFSAHSLPTKIIKKGDPYEKQITQHVQILKDLLSKNDINFSQIHLSYQSKLGPISWLKPCTANKLHEFKDKNVLVFPLSFCIDNSETDFELSIEYQNLAQKIGIKKYIVAKCPNDKDEFAYMIKDFLS